MPAGKGGQVSVRRAEITFHRYVLVNRPPELPVVRRAAGVEGGDRLRGPCSILSASSRPSKSVGFSGVTAYAARRDPKARKLKRDR